jgi:Ring finger domain
MRGSINFSMPGEIRINESNFEKLVPITVLNFKGNCNLCKTPLDFGTETRILPCEDPFHGKCIHNYMIKQINRICPVCNRNYS